MKKGLIVLLILSSFITSGCWDQLMLKDLVIALAGGFDLAPNNEFLATLSIPYIQKSSGQTGGAIPRVKIINTISPTPRKARDQVNEMIAKNIDTSKLSSLGIGKKLAKSHILPYLDIFYRDPRSALNAYLYLADGKASDILHLNNRNNPHIGLYISELIKSSIDVTLIPKSDIQRISADLMDPGADFVLPVISINKKEQTLTVKGEALFHGDTYTGTYLKQEDSILLQLLKGIKEIAARQTIKVFKEKKTNLENYANINVKYTHPHLKIKMGENHKPTVNLVVNMGIRVEEYPHDKLFSDKEKADLNSKLSRAMTLRAKHVIDILQRNNCDDFAIGRRINAFYHQDWVAMDKKNYFKNVKFNVKVNTRLLENGVIY